MLWKPKKGDGKRENREDRCKPKEASEVRTGRVGKRGEGNWRWELDL